MLRKEKSEARKDWVFTSKSKDKVGNAYVKEYDRKRWKRQC